MQEKLRRGLSANAKDFTGFNLIQSPPDTNALNKSIKQEILAAIAMLMQQPEVREQLRVACQRLSRSSTSTQLLHDSQHLLKQAGDDLLLVGIVVNPKQTSAGLHKNFVERFLKALGRAVDAFLRLPPYVLQHATYTAVVPNYGKIALVVRELAQIYINNPSVFVNLDLFQRAVETMLDILQEQFFSPTGLPPAVRNNTLFP